MKAKKIVAKKKVAKSLLPLIYYKADIDECVDEALRLIMTGLDNGTVVKTRELRLIAERAEELTDHLVVQRTLEGMAFLAKDFLNHAPKKNRAAIKPLVDLIETRRAEHWKSVVAEFK